MMVPYVLVLNGGAFDGARPMWIRSVRGGPHLVPVSKGDLVVFADIEGDEPRVTMIVHGDTVRLPGMLIPDTTLLALEGRLLCDLADDMLFAPGTYPGSRIINGAWHEEEEDTVVSCGHRIFDHRLSPVSVRWMHPNTLKAITDHR